MSIDDIKFTQPMECRHCGNSGMLEINTVSDHRGVLS